MEFKVVDIPEKNFHGEAAVIIKALLENVGKAIEIPVGERDANTVRKNIRSSLSGRGLIRSYWYRSVTKDDGKVLTVWLEKKPEKTVEMP